MQRNPYKDKILKTIHSLAYRHSSWSLFSDFVELGALCIANSTTLKGSEDWQKREDQYLATIGKYSKDEQKLFPQMFADLVEALQYALTWNNGPADILGKIFHDLELHNKYKGQFLPRNTFATSWAKLPWAILRQTWNSMVL